MKENRKSKIVIRIEEVNDLVDDERFYRVIINSGERSVNILETDKKPEILKYKSLIKS